MALNEKLTARVRETLVDVAKVKEKKMFRGITFMVDDKMCIGVGDDELMCRIDPALQEEVLEKNGCRAMVHAGKTIKGYVFVHEDVLSKKKELEYWVGLCLEHNKIAKASKARKSRSK